VVANLELGVEALARLAGDDRVKTPYPRLAVGLEQPVDPRISSLRAGRSERSAASALSWLTGFTSPCAAPALPAAGSIPKWSVHAVAGFPLA
jgi:hypothetical protein